MDPSRILVALEEREKWRDRRQRFQARLRAVQAQKRYLQRELDAVRRRVARLEALITGYEAPPPRDMPLATFEQIR